MRTRFDWHSATLVLVAGVYGCGSASETPVDSGPPPADAVVIDARTEPGPDAGEDSGALDAGPMRPDAGRRPDECLRDSPTGPYAAIPTNMLAAGRGWQLRRGVLHVHTVHSWDACDERGYTTDGTIMGTPDFINGMRNEQCYRDLRNAICRTRQDWVYLTDHRNHYPDFEYPALLLYDAAAGDELVMDGGAPVANRMMCEDGHRALLTTGVDYDVLGIGMNRHVAATPDDRRMVYGSRTAAAFDEIRAAGGVVIGGYVPRWDRPDDLWELPFEGLEVYNPVFNLQDRIGEVGSYVFSERTSPLRFPVPELAVLLFFEETEDTLRRWAAAVQHRRLPSVLGSNAHQNVNLGLSSDGERLDSYRRLLHWFSNYVMVRDTEQFTQELVEERIRAGMTFGVFDYLGYAQGFDYRAEDAGTITEMGSEVPVGATLRVTAPTVAGISSSAPAPEIRVRILRAREGCPLVAPTPIDDHCWEEVASGTGEISHVTDRSGVYRAEARIVPNHLTPCLGVTPQTYLNEYLWVYGNAIYVGMSYGSPMMSAHRPRPEPGLMCGGPEPSHHCQH